VKGRIDRPRPLVQMGRDGDLVVDPRLDRRSVPEKVYSTRALNVSKARSLNDDRGSGRPAGRGFFQVVVA